MECLDQAMATYAAGHKLNYMRDITVTLVWLQWEPDAREDILCFTPNCQLIFGSKNAPLSVLGIASSSLLHTLTLLPSFSLLYTLFCLLLLHYYEPAETHVPCRLRKSSSTQIL